MLPNWNLLDPLIDTWLLEDIGRGDHTTAALLYGQINPVVKAQWIAKEDGVVVGLPIAERVFQSINSDQFSFQALVKEGQHCHSNQVIVELIGHLDTLLTGERVALNIVMRLSGIATATQKYAQKIADLPSYLVDTRKTTPGLRILEKYASRLGGARNHRLGLDDALMLKDNHIKAFGGIKPAVAQCSLLQPYPLNLEVETSNLDELQEALSSGVGIVMLDNMSLQMMSEAVTIIRNWDPKIKIEASGNITLETIRPVALTGVDYISTSAPITRSTWLDISMKMI
jgi:nicotinate-nucleotide pyrophosphorylase (carboxylating)